MSVLPSTNTSPLLWVTAADDVALDSDCKDLAIRAPEAIAHGIFGAVLE